jgi:hypothetical protein
MVPLFRVYLVALVQSNRQKKTQNFLSTLIV